VPATCPVCDYKLEGKPIKVKIGDRVVVVCCQECADAVRKQPEKYQPKK
jgi:ribosome-binding protein aMBF1 (putative translation factor)